MQSFLVCILDVLIIMIPFFKRDAKKVPSHVLLILSTALIDWLIGYATISNEVLRELARYYLFVFFTYLYEDKKSYAMLEGLIAITIRRMVVIMFAVISSLTSFHLQTPLYEMIIYLVSAGSLLLYRISLNRFPVLLTDDDSLVIYLPIITQILLNEILFNILLATGNFSYGWIMFLSLAAFITSLFLVKKQLLLFREHYENLYVAHSLKVSQNQIVQWQEEATAIRKIRHDMAHHFNVLYSLLQQGKKEEAMDYLEESKKLIHQSNSQTWCGNSYIDATLNYKISSHSSVRFLTDIKVPKTPCVSAVDIGILLSNLMDNAIQEVLSFENDKTVTVSLMQKENLFFLRVSNPLSKEKSLKTEKQNHLEHGLGLDIVRNIVQHYNGEMTIEQENTFDVRIMLVGKEEH